ncbi:MAG: type II toxin-antitoxin system HicA family toxin [Defluviitaleaceae bacterium]|nr:type II toxin-antitoxin system HicA family toxin [Defluviitaleaceae bacterium]
MGDYTRKVKKILSENGYKFERRGKGDHEIWYNPNTKKSVSVDGEIKLRTSASELLKDAGLGKRF